jgi:Emfourin
VRLELTRSGGIGGLNVTRSIDTSALEAQQAQEVERLASQLDLADLARHSPLRGRGADRFQYDLSVEVEGRRYDVTLAEDVAPPELKELLAWIVQHDDTA